MVRWSTPPVTSSIRIMRGCMARPRASSSRLRWPVESSRAKWLRFSSRSTKASASSAASRACFMSRGAGQRADHDVLGHGEIGEGLELLEGARDAAAGDAVGPQAGDLAAVEEDAAGVGRLEAGDQVEQRRLAGAVGADDAEDLALVDIEGDVGVGGEAAEALGHAFDVEQQAHVRLPPRRRMRSSNRLRMPRGPPHADRQDQQAVDDEIDGAAGAAEPDAAVLRQRDQDGRAERRTPQRAAAAEHGHQQRR